MSVLDEILAGVRDDVAARQAAVPLEALKEHGGSTYAQVGGCEKQSRHVRM